MMKSRNAVLVASLAGLSLLLCAVLFWVRTLQARPQGIAWEPIALPAALEKARASHRRVLVKFDAVWCPSCKALDREVIQTREGAAIAEKLIAVRFDFDDEANRPLTEKYVVMTLPLVLVLDSDGVEVGRISGYEGKDKWLLEVRAATIAEDPVPALRAAWAARPQDPKAAVALGEALLVRGKPDEGEALLERVTWMQGAREEAAQALFLLGRYHQRVRKDSRTARHIWRELASRFPDSEWAAGAWSWHAKAQAEIGQRELGLIALQSHVRTSPKSTDAAADLASYVVKHKLEAERAAAAAALQAVMQYAKEGDKKDLQELADKLAGPL
jgi:hypothetical protein